MATYTDPDGCGVDPVVSRPKIRKLTTAWSVLHAIRALHAAGLEYVGRRKMFTLDGEDHIALSAVKGRPDLAGEWALHLISRKAHDRSPYGASVPRAEAE